MKILVATEKAFAPVAVSQIREVTDAGGHTLVLLENYKSVSELVTAVADADAMIVRSDLVTAEILAAAKKMKIVVRAGAGYDNLDLAACTAHKVRPDLVLAESQASNSAVKHLDFMPLEMLVNIWLK
jgi:D-3-phosphoglycerate dehydrogenase